MPVEIRKIVIKAEVETGGNNTAASGGSDTQSPVNQQALIDNCVRQVLKILQKEKER